MAITGIEKEALDFILEVSRETAPLEFAGLLRAEGGRITEIIVLPGTESSEVSAALKLYMLPNMKIAGSVHSHPTSDLTPSSADLAFFNATGSIHIIVGAPYNRKSWACYNRKGERIELPII